MSEGPGGMLAADGRYQPELTDSFSYDKMVKSQFDLVLRTALGELCGAQRDLSR